MLNSSAFVSVHISELYRKILDIYALKILDFAITYSFFAGKRVFHGYVGIFFEDFSSF